jgi:Uma2 family endonuclease
MTFEEFERMPDHGRRYELRHGEPVEVPPPKHGPKLIELRLVQMLGAAGGSAGVIAPEVGFRPSPGFEYWIADVVYVNRERWDKIPKDGYMDRVRIGG